VKKLNIAQEGGSRVFQEGLPFRPWTIWSRLSV